MSAVAVNFAPQRSMTEAVDLRGLRLAASSCTRCGLSSTRKRVVFGAGAADASLMFVGEAPDTVEEAEGKLCRGAAGELLDELLGSIGIRREDVYITSALRCRPPGSRDPESAEIEACSSWLVAEARVVRPHVVATFGGFAAKLLSGRPAGISRCHGRESVARFGDRSVWLLPLYGPAAALGSPAFLSVLRTDFLRIRHLLDTVLDADAPSLVTTGRDGAEQLGLFAAAGVDRG